MVKTIIATKTLGCINSQFAHILIIMPQIVPFYFTNQITFVFGIFIVMLYFVSKYILPLFVSLFSTRLSLGKF